MSPSKHDDTDEDDGCKKFLINHTFTHFDHLAHGPHPGKIETQFGTSWRLCLTKLDAFLHLSVEFCSPPVDNSNYSIFTEITSQLVRYTENRSAKMEHSTIKTSFSPKRVSAVFKRIDYAQYGRYVVNGALPIEVLVKIQKITGVKPPLRVFDEKSEFSDVILMVKGQKFHVLKRFLASHSTYFKALLMGDFEESKMDEVELKEVDPVEFQNFLELIHGESVVEDSTIEGIMKVADMYDCKSAVRRCEEYLLTHSKASLQKKFGFANKYRMEGLMKKCLSDITCANEICSILPKNLEHLDPKLSNELLLKSLSFCK